jgi:glutaminyl-tRNA synthetase
MYDFTHCLSDSIEGITHSLCSLEFEDHRPLYDWYIDQLGVHHPQQIEFARLSLTYTVMSKRKLVRLVKEGLITANDSPKIPNLGGWDDPRMPTLSGMRRRGYSPESIRAFADRVGVAKRDSTVDLALLEHHVREDLNLRARRVMAVLDPLKVVIENYPEGQTEALEAVNNPEDPNAGTRMIPFTREIYIERSDFMEDPPKKFFRLAPGREVRLKHAYFITCTDVIKDDDGEIIELRCTYDPATKSGSSQDGRKVKGTLHWVSADQALDAQVRLFENLFAKENPEVVEEGQDFRASLNPYTLEVIESCKVEPSLAEAKPGEYFQFLRHGYFCVDSKDSKPSAPVFNRTIGLRDSWAKMQKND